MSATRFPILRAQTRTIAAFGVALVLGLFSVWLLSPESRIGTSLVRTSYDWSQGLLPEIQLSNSPVVIVYLDLDSYLSEKQNPMEPWSRELHAQLVDRLTAAKVRAVVFDIIFDQTGTDATADQDFAKALKANGKVVLAGETNPSSRATLQSAGIERIEYSLPEKPFLDVAAAWGVASMKADSDFVVRQYFSGFPSPAPGSLSAVTAALAGVPATNITKMKWVRYYGEPFIIPHVSYRAALQTNEVSDEFFRDKIVFIGARPMAGTFLGRQDQFRSPFAYWGGNELFMPAVEVQATQLLNLIRGDSLRRYTARSEALLLLGFSAVLALLLFRFRPLPAAGAALIAESIVFGGAWAALAYARTWFPWLIVEAVQIPGALAGSVLWQSVLWYKQRRRFEEQRRLDEAKIREQAALIEKAQDAIFVQDTDGRIVYANPSAERLYGWTAAELAGSTVEPLLAPEAARVAARATGEWLGELEQTTRDGRKLTVSSRCTLIKSPHNTPKSFLFINTDVTEKKKLETEFFRAQRAQSVGALAGGMAHDLNNAFAPILMGLQLLQQQRQDDDTRRMLSVMEQNTQRGAEMVQQVLLFCRGADGEKQPIALGTLLAEMDRMIRQTFPRSINVAVLAPNDLWPVLGNATQLHQVLLNLGVNARDAMPKGGELTLAADNVELDASEAAQIPNGAPGQYVMLLVSDTGSGIPAEVMPRIFEPFYTTKPIERGTGLGLSTVARIVSHHRGFINVKSELGHGTTFEIYLPREIVAPVEGAVPQAELKRGRGELILVADDEQAVLEMISVTLEAQGYQVLTASNGAEALAQFESHGKHGKSVRLVLLDTDMPVMDGPQAISVLRARAKDLPIILMSGQMNPTADLPSIHKLAKPFQLPKLLSTIADCLGKSSDCVSGT